MMADMVYQQLPDLSFFQDLEPYDTKQVFVNLVMEVKSSLGLLEK
jgi:hypothetical protein